MSETALRNPNVRISKINRIVAPLTAAALLGTLGVVFEMGASSGNAFSTDIPVPTEAQPHVDYTVKPGDTESSITAKFNVTGFDTTDYENMLNKQLPKADQHDRMLQPGEELRLPPVTG